jgi:hypothetical protein
MTADLTVDTLSFKQVYSDKSGSERRESSRGPTLPEVMTIRHQDIVDSTTKLPSKRSVLRLDRYMSLATEAVIAPVSAYIVVQTPKSASIASSDVLAAIQRLITVLQEDDSGLDLMDEIFTNYEQ